MRIKVYLFLLVGLLVGVILGIKYWKELKYRNVVRQKYDHSCGVAALATLITFYFGEEVSEKEVIGLILKDKTKTEIERISKKGFSLLSLKEAAEKLGYVADTRRLKLEHLKKLRSPIIVFIKVREYGHFTVLKRINENNVYLADPSRGNIRLKADNFEKQWDGVALAINKR